MIWHVVWFSSLPYDHLTGFQVVISAEFHLSTGTSPGDMAAGNPCTIVAVRELEHCVYSDLLEIG